MGDKKKATEEKAIARHCERKLASLTRPHSTAGTSRPVQLDEPSSSMIHQKEDQAEVHLDLSEDTNASYQNQDLPLSTTEKQISNNLESCSSQKYVEDKHAFILVDSSSLCSFLT